MNVCGSSSIAFSPARVPVQTSASNFSDDEMQRPRRASSSTTMKPTLWRWRSYSRPELPRPQINFTDRYFFLSSLPPLPADLPPTGTAPAAGAAPAAAGTPGAPSAPATAPGAPGAPGTAPGAPGTAP